MEQSSSLLRTAFLLSVADVFFGAIGVLVILIVLSGSIAEERIVERFDHLATCSGSDAASLRLILDGGSNALTLEEWLTGTPSDRFMLRYGIRPEGEDITCYHVIRQAALEHNRKLEQRGATQAVLSIEYWPREQEP